MPPSDYKSVVEHGKHAAVVAPFLLTSFRERLRSWWNRLFHRDSVEGHKVEGLK